MEGWGRPGGGYRHPELTVGDYSSYRWPIRGVQRGEVICKSHIQQAGEPGFGCFSLIVRLGTPLCILCSYRSLGLEETATKAVSSLREKLSMWQCLCDGQRQRLSNPHYCLSHPDGFPLMQEGLTRFSSINSFYSSLEAFLSPTRTHLLEFCNTAL